MLLHRQIEWSLVSPIICMRPGTTLSIQHHGLFSPIICMRPVTTLSVYTTPWSLFTNHIHETRNHVHGLMYGIGEKRPWCCIDRQSGPWSHVWDWWEETMMLYRKIEWSMVSWIELVSQGTLYLPIQHHGPFSPTLFMRPWTTLSVYNIMVSSH
jgi:hypothetical protein